MDDARKKELTRRYTVALHAMQAGVALQMEREPKSTTPKHLRVGVNSALIDSGALAALLIRKGVIGEEEYYEALCVHAEREVEKYEALLEELIGIPITLRGTGEVS